ncbi:MAG: response regulator [Elusimicrobia bacterium]|nr:response regulator [Elusimicrobiota bacterium]
MAKILVVDDEPDIVCVIRTILSRLGHQVHCAGTAAQAERLLGLRRGGRALRPDLAILDLVLPGGDGYALASRMRLDPKTRDIPLILATARLGLSSVFGGASNVAAQLQKPFDPRELARTVEAALSGARPGPEPGPDARPLTPPSSSA